MTSHGTIYLVGSGPGDTTLITVKGLALVREADAIVGDVLSHAKLLQEARPDIEIYDVGCRAARNKRPQDEINKLLIDLAKQDKAVVRLWPGDPFIFGRAAQEMAAARQAGIRFEIVPGVSSALAAPAYAGVPVTHWEYATSFAVVTGYESKNPAVRADWTALARMETLVILMPLDNLSDITAKLVAAGRNAATPALAVQQGTLPAQKQILATLGTIVDAVTRAQIDNPAIVVVGPVAELTRELSWFKAGHDCPLLGQRVLVTRPAHQATTFMADLRALGAEPISYPTINIRPVEDPSLLDEAIRRIATSQAGGPGSDIDQSAKSAYDWLVLTSVNGVVAFWDRLQSLGLDSRCLATVKIAAIGPATAAALSQRSINPDLVPPVYTAEAVLEALEQRTPIAGQRFLLPRADIARKALADGLRAQGGLVDEIASYRTVPLQSGPPPPPADIVTFTSSSTVQGYVNCLKGRPAAELLKHSWVVCIGPITAATARKLDVPVSAVAESYTIEGLLSQLRAVVKNYNTKGTEIR